VCEQFSLIILNGLLNGDKEGHFTYIVENGSSVIDYVLVSRDILKKAAMLKVLGKTATKHNPVEFLLSASAFNESCVPPSTQNLKVVERFVWDPNKSKDYQKNLKSIHFLSQLNSAMETIELNINRAIEMLVESIKFAGICMKKVYTLGQRLKEYGWFDAECRRERKHLRRSLKLFKDCNDVEKADKLRVNYTKNRKFYKLLCKQKQNGKGAQTLETLMINLNNPRLFWGTIKASICKLPSYSLIDTNQWFHHFKNVFDNNSSDVIDHSTSQGTDETDVMNSMFNLDTVSLDKAISEDEVMQAIQHLKNGKACGIDGISGEFFKYSSPDIVIFLTNLFNNIFDTGEFPSSWSEAIIHPVHKKGDTTSPDNYRGISLLNISCKLYTYILNKRLTSFAEENNILNESQAGFRKQYSTVDHIFTLLSVVQKQLSRPGGKLYAAFIDFKKAFDLVDRSQLWMVLRKKGIDGKMYRAIKSMYTVVQARVRVNHEFTESFKCPNGLKQGDNCSPILFSLLINELADDIVKKGKHGITLNPDMLQLFILLFADDVVLLSHSVVGLQCQLNNLGLTSKQLGLTVNMDKSKIIVFRNGGPLASYEKWKYNGERLNVVNEYKYLGVIFSSRLTFSHALEDMASRGKKGVCGILRFLWSLGKNNPQLFFKMFDTQIQPILTYGCEVWGLTADHTALERVHLFAIKRLLNVSIKTPTVLIYNESGRYPMYIQTHTRCIKFWLKLTRMDDSRLPRKAYTMLYRLHSNNSKNWVTNVCTTLHRYGFGHVWQNGGVENMKCFLYTFKQRLIDCHLQYLDGKILSNSRYSFYSSFREINTVPYYLSNIINPYLRKWLCRLRLGVSPLKPHALRFSHNDNKDCPFCSGQRETELHFILCCPYYDDLRKRYIDEKYCSSPNHFMLTKLLSDQRQSVALALYLSKAFGQRLKG
jgi:hypothetical protein